MSISIHRFCLLITGLLFCVFGCAPDRTQVLMPDDISPPTEVHEPVDVEVAFAENILPILTARCALSGCHVADGPHGLDFRTYASFKAGGEHGPAFIAGNAEESEVVEQIVSGNMPPAGPPLSAAEIQLFVDWINQQEAHGDIVEHGHGEEHADDADADTDMDDDHDDDMDDDHDANMDDDHDDMDIVHDEDEDEHDDDMNDDMNGNHDDDNGHDDDDDNNDHDDDDN